MSLPTVLPGAPRGALGLCCCSGFTGTLVPCKRGHGDPGLCRSLQTGFASLAPSVPSAKSSGGRPQAQSCCRGTTPRGRNLPGCSGLLWLRWGQPKSLGGLPKTTAAPNSLAHPAPCVCKVTAGPQAHGAERGEAVTAPEPSASLVPCVPGRGSNLVADFRVTSISRGWGWAKPPRRQGRARIRPRSLPPATVY